MHRMTRVSLLDVARGWPGSQGSTTVTAKPCSLSPRAVHQPMTPAPATTTSAVISPRSPCRALSWLVHQRPDAPPPPKDPPPPEKPPPELPPPPQPPPPHPPPPQPPPP